MSCDNRCIGDDVFPAPCGTCEGRKPAAVSAGSKPLWYKCHSCGESMTIEMMGEGYTCPKCGEFKNVWVIVQLKDTVVGVTSLVAA